MQQLSNAGMNNANMGRGNAASGAMNPVAVLQLLQSLQGLSQLAQLTSNLNNSGGGLGAALGSLTGAGGMAGVGGAPGMSDSAASNPLAALSGLGMLGNSLGLGAGTGTVGGSGSLGGGMGSFLQGDSGASGKQVFVRNVSVVFFLFFCFFQNNVDCPCIHMRCLWLQLDDFFIFSRESCRNIQMSSRKIAPKSLKSHPVYRNFSKKMNVGKVVLSG